MHDIKQILAIAVREARTELGLSQEKLAETLNIQPTAPVTGLVWIMPKGRQAPGKVCPLSAAPMNVLTYCV